MWTATPDECRAGRRLTTSAVASVLLVLHSPVLKPYLDLLLGQAEGGGDLDASQARQVLAGGELVLESQQLRARERRTQALRRRAAAASALWRLTAVLLCIRVRNR